MFFFQLLLYFSKFTQLKKNMIISVFNKKKNA
jgi:hypothetical protein